VEVGAAERGQGVVAEDGEVGPDERPQQPSGRGDQGMWMWSSSKNARASATVAAGRIAGAPWIIIVRRAFAAEELDVIIDPAPRRCPPSRRGPGPNQPADQGGHGRARRGRYRTRASSTAVASPMPVLAPATSVMVPSGRSPMRSVLARRRPTGRAEQPIKQRGGRRRYSGRGSACCR